jgi:ureidoglycolate dehydrogenase (NAD+)
MQVPADETRDFIIKVFREEGVQRDAATAVADGLVHASLRGVDSHGVRLLPHYLDELTAGRIDGSGDYEFERTGESTGILDAKHGFGHAAGMAATNRTKELADSTGAGVVAVTHSNHFGACSYYSIDMARDGLIGIAMTHSDSLVVPTGGVRSFLGNNPISIAAPTADEEPVCLDMATSKITFNEVLKHREEGKKVPPSSGVDADGMEIRNPEEIENLLPVGGYKGYGLGVIIEILCSVLTGMDYGPHLTKMYDDDIEETRNLGHIYLAIDIESFDSLSSFRTRVQNLIDELRDQPAHGEGSIKVPGDPEKETKQKRQVEGIPLRETDIDSFQSLADIYELSIPDLI